MEAWEAHILLSKDPVGSSPTPATRPEVIFYSLRPEIRNYNLATHHIGVCCLPVTEKIADSNSVVAAVEGNELTTNLVY